MMQIFGNDGAQGRKVFYTIVWCLIFFSGAKNFQIAEFRPQIGPVHLILSSGNFPGFLIVYMMDGIGSSEGTTGVSRSRLDPDTVSYTTMAELAIGNAIQGHAAG